jgi:hypothetical protein
MSSGSEWDPSPDPEPFTTRPGDAPPAGPPALLSGVNVLLGLWLIVSPWVLDYREFEAAVWNSIVVGVAVFVLAIARAAAPLQFEGLSRINVVLGLWLAVSAWVLPADDEAEIVSAAMTWNFIVVGVLIAVLAVASTITTRDNPAYDPDDRRVR